MPWAVPRRPSHSLSKSDCKDLQNFLQGMVTLVRSQPDIQPDNMSAKERREYF